MTVEAKPLLICTTARSGSNLLADYLNNTGLFGWVAEYFNPKIIREGLEGRPFSSDGEVSLQAYVAYLRATFACPEGRWGAKLLYEDAEHLVAFPAIQDLLTHGTIVFLRRREKLSQAISYFLAKSTGKWLATDEGHAPPEAVPFDYDALESILIMLASQEAMWTTLFARLELDPLEVVYEDLVVDPAKTLRAILTEAGLTPRKIEIRTCLLEQKNAVNQDFARRFNARKWASLEDPGPVEYEQVMFRD